MKARCGALLFDAGGELTEAVTPHVLSIGPQDALRSRQARDFDPAKADRAALQQGPSLESCFLEGPEQGVEPVPARRLDADAAVHPLLLRLGVVRAIERLDPWLDALEIDANNGSLRDTRTGIVACVR